MESQEVAKIVEKSRVPFPQLSPCLHLTYPRLHWGYTVSSGAYFRNGAEPEADSRGTIGTTARLFYWDKGIDFSAWGPCPNVLRADL